MPCSKVCLSLILRVCLDLWGGRDGEGLGPRYSEVRITVAWQQLFSSVDSLVLQGWWVNGPIKYIKCLMMWTMDGNGSKPMICNDMYAILLLFLGNAHPPQATNWLDVKSRAGGWSIAMWSRAEGSVRFLNQTESNPKFADGCDQPRSQKKHGAIWGFDMLPGSRQRPYDRGIPKRMISPSNTLGSSKGKSLQESLVLMSN